MKYPKLMWALSIIVALFAIFAFSEKGILGGLLFLALAVFLNPKFREVLEAKGITIKKGVTVAGSIVAFCVACLLTPTDTNHTEATKLAESVIETTVEETTEMVTTVVETEAELAEVETTIEETTTVAETETQPVTEAPTTVAETEAPTEAPTTVAETEASTEAPTTVAETEASTEAPTTMAETQPVTEAITTAPEPQGGGDPYKGNITFTGHYYRTKSGKCYHYSAECGSANSIETTWEEIQRLGLQPCGTCVLK